MEVNLVSDIKSSGPQSFSKLELSEVPKVSINVNKCFKTSSSFRSLICDNFSNLHFRTVFRDDIFFSEGTFLFLITFSRNGKGIFYE